VDPEDFDLSTAKIVGVNCILDSWLREKVLKVTASEDIKNINWPSLREKAQLGDEVWEFRSSAESWKHLAGQAGIALVRSGEVVAYVIARIN
jgi:hypothetical protein